MFRTVLLVMLENFIFVQEEKAIKFIKFKTKCMFNGNENAKIKL